MMVLPIVVDALGTVLKDLDKRLEKFLIRRRIKTIQTTALLRWAGIIRRVQKPEESGSHLDSSERPPADMDVKNLQIVK